MKIFKKLLVIAASIIAILLITALFVKTEYTIEKSITINKPKADVFSYVKYLKNQDHYNKWAMMDPNSKKEYKGTDGTVGFVSTWNSENKNVGKGEQEIKSLSEGERIDLGLHFIKPFKGDAAAWMTTESLSESGTKLKWGMQGRNPYPLNLINLFIPGMLGKDLETSLTTLKTLLEKG